jgi:CrcB protein
VTPQPGPPTDASQALRREVRDLALVAAGAVPGALLRWRLEVAGRGLVPGLGGVTEADLVANMLGSFLLGLIVSLPTPRPRLMLLGGIGFCGSLTTFSSWILELSLALRRGRPFDALAVVLVSLVGGLVLLGLGALVGRTLGKGRAEGGDLRR